jgi:hypothetical protein
MYVTHRSRAASHRGPTGVRLSRGADSRKSLLRLAPHTVAIPIKVIDICPDDGDRPLHVLRPVAVAAFAVDVTGDRNAGTGVVRVALGALRKRYRRGTGYRREGDPQGKPSNQQCQCPHGGKGSSFVSVFVCFDQTSTTPGTKPSGPPTRRESSTGALASALNLRGRSYCY